MKLFINTKFPKKHLRIMLILITLMLLSVYRPHILIQKQIKVSQEYIIYKDRKGVTTLCACIDLIPSSD